MIPWDFSFLPVNYPVLVWRVWFLVSNIWHIFPKVRSFVYLILHVFVLCKLIYDLRYIQFPKIFQKRFLRKFLLNFFNKACFVLFFLCSVVSIYVFSCFLHFLLVSFKLFLSANFVFFWYFLLLQKWSEWLTERVISY